MKVLGVGDRGCVVQETDDGTMVTKVLVSRAHFEQEKENVRELIENSIDVKNTRLIYPTSFIEVAIKADHDSNAYLSACLQSLKSTLKHVKSNSIYLLQMKNGGKSLASLASDTTFSTKPFTFDEAVSILKQILEGIQILHKKNFAHGDLHDNNITISTTTDRSGNRQLNAYIIDFGENMKDKNMQRDIRMFITVILSKVQSLCDDEAKAKITIIGSYIRSNSIMNKIIMDFLPKVSANEVNTLISILNETTEGIRLGKITKILSPVRTRSSRPSSPNQSSAKKQLIFATSPEKQSPTKGRKLLF